MSSKQVNKSDGQPEVVMSEDDLDGVPMEVENGPGDELQDDSKPRYEIRLFGNGSISAPTDHPRRVTNHHEPLCPPLQMEQMTQSNAQIRMHILWAFCEEVKRVRNKYGVADTRTKVEVKRMLAVFELLKVLEEIEALPPDRRYPETAGPSTSNRGRPAEPSASGKKGKAKAASIGTFAKLP